MDWFVPFAVGASIGILIWPVVGVIYDWFRARKLYDKAIDWVIVHRGRIKGDNRFPVGENYFSQHFYDYPPKLTRRVWLRLVREGLIHSDPLDGEWIVK